MATSSRGEQRRGVGRGLCSLPLDRLRVSLDAALPWLDSFTTVAAVVATWMVARKIFENWLYWFVIDSVSIYLYLSRDLPLTAILFAGYLVMIVIGSLRWWRTYQQQPAFAG